MTTETKFTPGPWLMSSPPHGRDIGIIAADNSSVCEVYNGDRFGSGGEDLPSNGEANARLIAAAPELLAACEALLKTYAWRADKVAAEEGENALHSSVRAARAAIAKAKGES